MMRFICYPRCSTCAKARRWLATHNIDVQEENIKTHPPTVADLETILNASGENSRKLFNTSGQVYRDMNLKDRLDDMSEADRLKLLTQNGMLVKRPLLLSDDGTFAIIGFSENAYEQTLLKP